MIGGMVRTGARAHVPLKTRDCLPCLPVPPLCHPLQRLFLLRVRDGDVPGKQQSPLPGLIPGTGLSVKWGPEAGMFRNYFKIHFRVKHTH